MGLFDIVTLTIIFVLGFKGLLTGFIKEAFGLFGIVGGVFVASRTAQTVGASIGKAVDINNSSTQLLVGFVISIVVFWVVAYLFGMMISKITDKSGLGFFDKILGFGFGVAKVFLIFSISVYAISQIKIIDKLINDDKNPTIMYEVFKQTGSYILAIYDEKADSNTTNEIKEKIIYQNIKKAVDDELKTPLKQPKDK
ncbi:MAG: hypothetical protein B1H07_02330 [Campylobacteraceae bacterium 4484_166]|nr:MAG: hypothetical protein B1H07_02330 [Campylobacteraceae bacterium 4484_166]